MIGLYDGCTYSNFRDLADFFREVMTPRYSGWRWFAHFGGKLDIAYLFDWLREHDPQADINFYLAGSCVISFTVRRGRYHWRFCDSYRLMDSALATLTTEFDVEHKKLDFNPTSIEYNRNDCIGLYEVLTAFFEIFEQTSETVAAHAMAVFRKDFLKREIYQPPRKVEEFIRAGYFGGRCEVYRFDERIVNKYDVNSLYPYAMLGPVPVEYIGYTTRLADDDSEIGFYRAEIEYPEVYLPVLPVMIGARLFFPVGKFAGVFSSIELRHAINHGAGVRISGGVIFKAEPILADFSRTLYEMKVKAEHDENPAIRYTTKKIMCSLYGKFGQRRDQAVYILDPGTSRLDPDDLMSPQIWPLPKGLAYYFRDSKASHILPHIAAAVTSRARTITLDYLTAAGKIWYTDTDSVFTTSKLATSDRLGSMKSEGRGYFRAFGLKEYKFDGHYNIKGISIKKINPKTGKKTEDPTIAEAYLKGIGVPVTRRAGLMESIRKGLPAARRIEFTKQRHERIEKRARAGMDTRPWNVSELA